ncbi:SpoIIE family protein phosphatase, partial [bacterium]|nr:SpoIIE family protein phosphatase [bacterium]
MKYSLISQRQNFSEWRTTVLSFWDNGNWGKTFEYDLHGAPCEAVFRDGPQWYGSDIQQRFPKDGALHKLGIQFYYGAPLKNHSGEVIGHLCVLHDKPVAFDPRLSEAVRIYAHLASREILLCQYENSQTQFQKSLQFIVSNMDCGILLEDENQIIRLMNQRFCDMFQLDAALNDFVGSNAMQCIENLQSKMQDRERFLVRTNEIRQVQDPVTCEEWFMKNDCILHLDVIPIQEDQSIQGILWLFRDATKQKSAEIELSNAQEQEIEIGSKIQKTLLLGVTPNDIPALNVAALTIPSKRIDGDFYDFFHVDETRLDVLVGDVMGKGVPAALLGAAVKSHFQRAMRKLLAAQAGGWPEPRQIVSLVHRAMTEQLIDLESFFTLFYIRFDVKQSECIYLDCGHMPTIWFQRNNQTCRLLNGDNLPLGVTELEKFEQRTISFNAGDFFVLYSDGITEAPSPAGELFGIERLQKLIQENHELSPNQLIQKLHQNLIAYTQSPHFSDDLTCVIVKITEKGVTAPRRKQSARFKSKMSELQKARDFITQFHDEQNEKTNFCSLQKLILAVNEAAANIIQHAYDGKEDFHWEMRIEEFHDRWVVSLLHD